MLLLYFLLPCWSSLVWARRTPPTCFDGCQTAFRTVQFNGTDPPNSWATACRNEFGVPSLYLCTKIYCTEHERIGRLDILNETCRSRANISLPAFSLVDGYTDEEIGKLRQLQPEEASNTDPTILNEVVVLSQQLFRLAFDTLEAAYFETRIHNVYGCSMYWFWVVVIGIGLSSHLGRFIFSSRYQDQKWQSLPGDEADSSENTMFKSSRSIFNTPYILLKRYITVPATFGYKRSQNVWWCTIPTRVQSIAIGAFISINIALCSCSYHVFPNNVYWPNVSAQLLRYFADRTGIISTANLPLIWLFGIRNNTLLWLTGWDFATYNNFHRWVARVATIEAILHSVAYTVMIVSGEGTFWEAWAYYITYYKMRYFTNGVLATVFMTAICVFSVYPLRRKCYEVFLWLHIVLSIFVIITMWYHVEPFSGYTRYVWPCVFIWLFDRILRVLRILSYNIKFWNTKAYTTYDSTSNIVRLVVPYSSSFIKPRPGTFYYIYTLNSWMFWENHPFTLGYSTPETQDPSSTNSPALSLGTISPPRRAPSPTTQQANSTSPSHFPESATLLEPSDAAPPSSMVFIIRPYNGFTARLRDSAAYHPTSHRVLIEGPYGETQPFHQYENVLFIVGGTGIAVPLSYLGTLLAEDASTASLRIIWAVREHEFLADAITKDFKDAFDGSGKLSLTAYVTKGEEADKDDETEELGRRIRVFRGRPNVFEEVEEAAKEAGDGSLAVVACGPGQMADDARRAVVEMLGRGFGRIEYFEESFNW